MWQAAWKLVGHDLSRAWGNYLLMLVISFIFGVWTGLMVLRTLISQEFSFDPYLIDFYFMAIIPIIGCPWYTRKHTERTYSQLKYYRTLPISTGSVILSRMILVFLRAIPNAILMFAGMYLASPALREVLPPSSYLWFIAICFGYGLGMSCWYPYWEIHSRSRVKLWLYTAGYVAAWLAVCAIVWFVFDAHIVRNVIDWSKTSGWIFALLSALFGGVSAWSWWRITKKNVDDGVLF